MFELAAANAVQYLSERGLLSGKARVKELGGGVSNTILLVETGDRRLVLKQALGKLRVKDDWFADRSRIFRESAAMRWLTPHLPAGSVPTVLFEDRENGFFAMSAAPEGWKNWKEMLLAGLTDAAVAETTGRMLAAVVTASWRNAEVEGQFGDQTVFDQLRIDPYYRTTAARHPELKEEFRRLMEASAARRVSLVHGDWSPKNFLVSGHGDVMAIDFEVAHYGDPSFDSAFLLNHLLLKTFYHPKWSASYAALAHRFWEVYRSGLPGGCDWIEAATLEHLGCLLLARIDGKSPAEYITEPTLRERVRAFAKRLILHPPVNVASVFDHARSVAA